MLNRAEFIQLQSTVLSHMARTLYVFYLQPEARRGNTTIDPVDLTKKLISISPLAPCTPSLKDVEQALLELEQLNLIGRAPGTVTWQGATISLPLFNLEVNFAPAKPFQMFPSWEPSASFHSIALQAGLVDYHYSETDLQNFINFWVDRSLSRNQQAWERSFVARLAKIRTADTIKSYDRHSQKNNSFAGYSSCTQPNAYVPSSLDSNNYYSHNTSGNQEPFDEIDYDQRYNSNYIPDEIFNSDYEQIPPNFPDPFKDEFPPSTNPFLDYEQDPIGAPYYAAPNQNQGPYQGQGQLYGQAHGNGHSHGPYQGHNQWQAQEQMQGNVQGQAYNQFAPQGQNPNLGPNQYMGQGQPMPMAQGQAMNHGQNQGYGNSYGSGNGFANNNNNGNTQNQGFEHRSNHAHNGPTPNPHNNFYSKQNIPERNVALAPYTRPLTEAKIRDLQRREREYLQKRNQIDYSARSLELKNHVAKLLAPNNNNHDSANSALPKQEQANISSSSSSNQSSSKAQPLANSHHEQANDKSLDSVNSCQSHAKEQAPNPSLDSNTGSRSSSPKDSINIAEPQKETLSGQATNSCSKQETKASSNSSTEQSTIGLDLGNSSEQGSSQAMNLGTSFSNDQSSNSSTEPTLGLDLGNSVDQGSSQAMNLDTSFSDNQSSNNSTEQSTMGLDVGNSAEQGYSQPMDLGTSFSADPSSNNSTEQSTIGLDLGNSSEHSSSQAMDLGTSLSDEPSSNNSTEPTIGLDLGNSAEQDSSHAMSSGNSFTNEPSSNSSTEQSTMGLDLGNSSEQSSSQAISSGNSFSNDQSSNSSAEPTIGLDLGDSAEQGSSQAMSSGNSFSDSPSSNNSTEPTMSMDLGNSAEQGSSQAMNLGASFSDAPISNSCCEPVMGLDLGESGGQGAIDSGKMGSPSDLGLGSGSEVGGCRAEASSFVGHGVDMKELYARHDSVYTEHIDPKRRVNRPTLFALATGKEDFESIAPGYTDPIIKEQKRQLASGQEQALYSGCEPLTVAKDYTPNSTNNHFESLGNTTSTLLDKSNNIDAGSLTTAEAMEKAFFGSSARLVSSNEQERHFDNSANTITNELMGNSNKLDGGSLASSSFSSGSFSQDGAKGLLGSLSSNESNLIAEDGSGMSACEGQMGLGVGLGLNDFDCANRPDSSLFANSNDSELGNSLGVDMGHLGHETWEQGRTLNDSPPDLLSNREPSLQERASQGFDKSFLLELSQEFKKH